MFGNSNLDRMRQGFADQFEPDGSNYLYRRRLKDAPIQVTAAERDRYVENYSRFVRYWYWGTLGGTILVALLFVTYAMETNDFPKLGLYIGLGFLFILLMGANYWARDLPTRELRGRGTSGDAWTPQDVKRITFSKITYGRLAGGVALALFIPFRVGLHANLLEGWNRLWFAVSAGLILLCAVQAFRKWRFESSQKP
jgi:hypothetical protein